LDQSHAELGSPLTPVRESDRIDSLDVLRGVALLGIFVMNIPTFAFSQFAFYKPPLQGGFEGADYWTWLGSHLFFEQKMMSIFSMLFGAGIVLFAERISQSRGAAAGVHYRRMGWLLAIGMLHAYGIWVGDILVAYAIVGMLVYPLRRLKPLTLLIIALTLLPIAAILGVLMQVWYEYTRAQAETGIEWAVDAWSQIEPGFYPDEQVLAEERSAVLGTFGERAAYMAPTVAFMQVFMLLFWGIWRIASMMLLGMALYKWGVFSAARSTRFYAILIGGGLLAGVPLVLTGVSVMHASDFDPLRTIGVNGAFNYFGSVGIALAWIGLVMLLCKSGAMGWLRAALAAVGRMAFTNYLAQSLIAAFIFYGWGLGYFGSMSRADLLFVVAGVWLFQIGFSLVWLRRFRFGPMEWLWRSLTYMRIAPLLRADPAAVSREGDTGQ
jgi:uncharacterized protein